MRFTTTFLFAIVFGISTVGLAQDQPTLPPNMVQATRLQVFLDVAGFRPGVIDGTLGGFTDLALNEYQHAFGWAETPAAEHKLPLESIDPPFTKYTIQPGDLNFVGPVPGSVADKAKVKRLPYPSLAEFVGERYHVSQNFLHKLNPKVKMKALKPGDTLWVPNVRPFKIEELAAEAKAPRPPAPGRAIRVKTKPKILQLIENDKVIGTFPISPGSKDLPAPAGQWKITSITLLPWYRYDKSVLETGKRSKNALSLPPGPRSPVGLVWMALNKPGVGLHGTPVPESVGRAESHGCIRLANWDAVRLSRMVAIDSPVTIE